jgi:hypothetical protein
MDKITRRKFLELLGLGAAAAAVGGVAGVAGAGVAGVAGAEAEEGKVVEAGKPCICCGLTPNAQLAHRHPGMAGLCGPGRCVVKGMVWLVMPDTGEPL